QYNNRTTSLKVVYLCDFCSAAFSRIPAEARSLIGTKGTVCVYLPLLPSRCILGLPLHSRIADCPQRSAKILLVATRSSFVLLLSRIRLRQNGTDPLEYPAKRPP
ncbi:unnamed protein product, partial [Amoebophrya sp. A120]